MTRYYVEFTGTVMITVPVNAGDEYAAREQGDAVLPRWPVIARAADDCPEGTDVQVLKGWELSGVEAGEQEHPEWFDAEAHKLGGWAPVRLLHQIAAGSGVWLDSALARRALDLREQGRAER